MNRKEQKHDHGGQVQLRPALQDFRLRQGACCPKGRAGFRACRLRSFPTSRTKADSLTRKPGTGKSPEPADRNVCLTSEAEIDLGNTPLGYGGRGDGQGAPRQQESFQCSVFNCEWKTGFGSQKQGGWNRRKIDTRFPGFSILQRRAVRVFRVRSAMRDDGGQAASGFQANRRPFN